MKTLRELVEEASTITDALFEPRGQMLAHILAIDRVGKRLLLASPMSDAQEEIWFRVTTPETLRRDGCQRWCFFTEAWMANYAAGSSPTEQPPKEHPDRLEVVTFAAEEAATGERLGASRQIYRATPEAPGRLLPLVFPTLKSAFVIAGQGVQMASRR